MSDQNNNFESIYTIPVKEAIQRTRVYQDQGHKVKALTVSFDDLIGLVNLYNAMNKGVVMPEEMYSGVRIYMGVNEDGSECAVLVPVVGYYGKDVPGMDSLSITDDQGKEISLCYDFSHPCPSTCDLESPLYHSVKEKKALGDLQK